MGCTPSIHLSQTGVVYCREPEDSNSSHTTAVNTSCRGVHSRVVRSNSSANAYRTAVSEQGNCITPTGARSSISVSASAPQLLSSRSKNDKRQLMGGDDTTGGVSESLAEIRRSQQNMKNFEHEVKFGPMMLHQKNMSVLLVFAKEDRQSEGFWWASDKLGYQYSIARTGENALENYLKHHHDVVIIDARNNSLDCEALCRSIKSIKASDYTVLVAVTRKYSEEVEEPSILPLLKAGISRRYQENCSISACINELQALEAGPVQSNLKLRACSGLFSALENITEAVEITDSNHQIQFVNHASERLCGYCSDELLGKNAAELRSDRNRDIIESINGHLKKGKHWEGTYYIRRKSGDHIPTYCKVIPVVEPSGIVSQYVSIKAHSSESSGQLANGSMMPFSKRRESFVRGHSMTIEAPITKVINIINAAQENSPLTVAQALDKVLEILQTSELYSPFQHQEIRPDDDPISSDFVEGLMSHNVKRRLSGHDIQKDLQKTSHQGQGHQHIPSSPACSLSQIPEPIMNILNLDSSWDFDIIALESLTNKRPLVHLGLKLCSRFGTCEFLNISETCLVNWLQMIESNYHSQNHYHNSTHAADVMHATAYFLDKDRSKEIFDQPDQVASLIAAAVHDVDHPARTNAFLINEKHDLAILYNDQAVLENHHASMCFRLTHKDPSVDIFKNLSSEDYKTMRQSIIDQVLATDMKQHFEHLSRFTTSITKHLQKLEGDNTDMETHETDTNAVLADLTLHENKVLIKRMMIKCADVSNPLRPLSLCKEWAYRIAEEYCQQTDEEKTRGLPVVMAQFDRKTLNIPKCQLAFINLFITTMFDAWDVYCDIPELMHHLQLNYDFWKLQEELKDKEQATSHGVDNS